MDDEIIQRASEDEANLDSAVAAVPVVEDDTEQGLQSDKRVVELEDTAIKQGMVVEENVGEGELNGESNNAASLRKDADVVDNAAPDVEVKSDQAVVESGDFGDVDAHSLEIAVAEKQVVTNNEDQMVDGNQVNGSTDDTSARTEKDVDHSAEQVIGIEIDRSMEEEDSFGLNGATVDAVEHESRDHFEEADAQVEGQSDLGTGDALKSEPFADFHTSLDAAAANFYGAAGQPNGEGVGLHGEETLEEERVDSPRHFPPAAEREEEQSPKRYPEMLQSWDRSVSEATGITDDGLQGMPDFQSFLNESFSEKPDDDEEGDAQSGFHVSFANDVVEDMPEEETVPINDQEAGNEELELVIEPKAEDDVGQKVTERIPGPMVEVELDGMEQAIEKPSEEVAVPGVIEPIAELLVNGDEDAFVNEEQAVDDQDLPVEDDSLNTTVFDQTLVVARDDEPQAADQGIVAERAETVKDSSNSLTGGTITGSFSDLTKFGDVISSPDRSSPKEITKPGGDSSSRFLRKQYSTGDEGGMKRPHSTSRMELVVTREDTIRQLLDRGADIEKEFTAALEAGDMHSLQQLLAAGATVNMLAVLFDKLVALFRAQNEDEFRMFPRLMRSARIGMSSRSRGPARTFSFGGKDACIDISGTGTFARSFPSSWGVSVWIWVASKCGPFTIASFLTKERYGVSVTLLPDDQEGRDTTLLFESADEKKRDGAKISLSPSQFRLRTWHHVFIQQSRKKAGTSNGLVVVRIDDKLIEEKALMFPGVGLTSPLTRSRVMEDFEGFTGPIWVLDGQLRSATLLSRQQVTPILAEGEEAVPGLGVFVSRSDQDPSPPVFASYHPERAVGNLCLDLHGSHLGTFVNACVPWQVQPARESLRSIGGPSVLLPFLRLGARSKNDPALCSEIVLQTLLLFATLLEGHGPNQNELYDSHGVSLVSFALEDLSDEVRNETLRDPGRDIVAALGSLARAFGLDSIGTSGEGTRLMRIINWRTRSVEYELDRSMILNLDFWIRYGANAENNALSRVVAVCARRIAERPGAYRKKFGVRFFLDSLRKMYEDVRGDGTMKLCCRRIGTAYVDTVIAPMLTDAHHTVKREEVRAILDACIGSGHGSSFSSHHHRAQQQQSSDPFRERRKNATWDEPTVELAHDALRLLVRLYQQPNNHVVLTSMNVPAILAVEVVAFGGLGERVRALALRAIGLALASSHSRDIAESFASIGGFSYLSSALSYAVVKGERRFAASTNTRSSSFDDTVVSVLGSPKGQGAQQVPPQRKSLSSSFASSRPFFLQANSSPPATPSQRSQVASTPPPSASSAFSSSGGNRGFVSAADLATSSAASTQAVLAHISDATYNALLSIVVTPSSISNCASNVDWKRASQFALADEEDFDPALPAVVLDDVLKIANVHALSMVLDQLSHMSPMVQQRTFQDLFVLLKFEQENRRAFYSIPNWQRTLASFLSSHVGGEEIGVFEMGVKLWVLVLHDACLKEPECLMDAYWLGESFGKQVSEAVLTGLMESMRQLTTAPSAPTVEALIKVGEVSPMHYPFMMQLLDRWKRLPELGGPFFGLVMKETARTIANATTDLGRSAQAARRAHRLLQTVTSSLAQSSNFGGENLFRDAAICVVTRVHERLERLQGKTEFLPEEMEFLDSCALVLVEAARILALQASRDSRSEMELIELASALMPHKSKPMPREAWLHSRWAMSPLEPGFSSLSDVTLDDISFTLKRTDRERYESKFARAQDALASLAKTRGDLENSVRESEERFVYAELGRMTSTALTTLNERHGTAEKWDNLIKELVNGETVWKDSELKSYWICPEREDYLRRHLVLERDLNGRTHETAAYESSLQQTGGGTAKTVPAVLDPPEPQRRHPKKEATFPFDSKEEICYVAEGARWVTPSVVVSGRVEVSALHVMFYAADAEDDKSTQTKSSSEQQQQQHQRKRERWRLDELVEIHSRRYLLRPTAIELFFSDRTTAFFAFQTQATRDECSSQILRQKPLRLEKAFTGSLAPPAQVFKRSRLTEMWRRREISNFEYLMRLNTIAGRTYNDVTQFFVFPWILTDYESEEINLDDHSKFRDLTKPVGALNPQREAEVCERYQAFTETDMGMPPFHHGSHYSSAGVVLHYLIRVEPYTTLAIELQGGRFDVSDRLFHSIRDCFRSCYSSVVDCRELIPEFFYLSEMFVNHSKLPLGTRQDGNPVDNVILPAWAKGDPERFVRMNRESLESEYVSESLHSWIDLIFGFKQRGKDAVEACNVFNHLSYEGAVDLDSISDPGRRAAVELQILEFGQCPSQLLHHPHPKRMSLNELGRSIALDLVREAFYFKSAHYKWNMLVWRKLAWQPSAESGSSSSSSTQQAVMSVPGAVVSGVVMTPMRLGQNFVKLFGGGATGRTAASQGPYQHQTATAVTPPPVVSLTAFQDRIVLVHADLTATVLHVVEGSDSASLELRPGSQMILPSAQACTYVTARSRDAGLVGTSLGLSLRGRPQDFVCTQGGNLVVSCPYFDGSIRCFRMDGTKIEVNVVGHRGRVSALAHDGRWLISGSYDGTAVLWKVGGSHDSKDEMMELFGDGAKSGQGPLLRIERYLAGHRAAVTSVAVSQLIGILATGAADGSLLVHALYDKSPSKTKRLDTNWTTSVDLIALCPGSGGIVAHSKQSMELVFFGVNGQLLGRVVNEEPWNFCEIVCFHEQEVVIGGGDKTGEIWIRRTPDLHVTRKISYAKRYRGVRCASVAPGGKYIFVGCVDGSVIALGDGTGVQSDLSGVSAEGGKKGMVVSE